MKLLDFIYWVHSCIERSYLPLILILFLWAYISFSLHVVISAWTIVGAEFALYWVTINHTVVWLARRGCPGRLEKQDMPGLGVRGWGMVSLEHLQRYSALGEQLAMSQRMGCGLPTRGLDWARVWRVAEYGLHSNTRMQVW